jgi:hypothetical protein
MHDVSWSGWKEGPFYLWMPSRLTPRALLLLRHQLSTSFRDGILTVEFPKREEAKLRLIMHYDREP